MYRTRRALKSLQYSSNGHDIVGLPQTKSLKSNLKDIQEVVCFEEKENPKVKRRSTRKIQYASVGIQCNKIDEDMVTGENVSNEYWAIMITRRKSSIQDCIRENNSLHDMIDVLNAKNEMLRNESKDLLELLNEVNDIKGLIDDLEDSGCVNGSRSSL